ncbi:hypothetical protein SAMN05192583_0406 [Sphingomonas gellani]|uniref:Uncharacterized protein n=1 Tax=Sphingomonas gellani TaxID=1166340 RepID=A0A1H7YUS5_9SPHN|nr:hypothetical protein [Sphingomonas gellani]SEM49614.1 hypothetical protein SAMN05192583_0406 [Sphingomonas gellani]
MLYYTPSHWAVLALVLVAGWLLGLASHSGGRRWRERYVAERDAHAVYRKDADARIAEADRRRAEIERDHARLAAAAPVTAATVTPATTTTAATAARPAYASRTVYPTDRPRRGWFDWR